MSKPGKFMFKKLKGKQVEIWASNESEYIHYADGDSFSWCIITGIVEGYDEEDGIITLKSEITKRNFYINEDTVDMFWEKGFDIKESTKATLRNLRKAKNRDIV